MALLEEKMQDQPRAAMVPTTDSMLATLEHLATTLRARDHVRGRYAPSPTGPLHLGNLRTALLAWLQCRLEGGTFVLRMEDLDQARSEPQAASGILEDLRWLGIDWDEGPDCGGPAGPYTQSERQEIYAMVFDRLLALGRIYPCGCSRRDIREAASAPHTGYIAYPGTCRPKDTDPAIDPAPHDQKSWRWRIPPHQANVSLTDQVVGPFAQDLRTEVGDFVIRRADGIFAYQLAVVIDDALMGITDVVRGDDLLDSAPRQVMLFAQMGWHTPRFWHVPLMHDKMGHRLSKRNGSQSLALLRDEGKTPEQVVSRLASSLGLCSGRDTLSAQQLLHRLKKRGGLAYMQKKLHRHIASP